MNKPTLNSNTNPDFVKTGQIWGIKCHNSPILLKHAVLGANSTNKYLIKTYFF